MADLIKAFLGFSQRDNAPIDRSEIAVPGYPDNRVVPVACKIHNARKRATTLGAEGFAIVQKESAFAAERDKRVLAVGYHQEMAEFLKGYLGASHVQPSGESALLVRFGERLVGRRGFERATDIIDDRIPASFAHVDYFPEVAMASARHSAENLPAFTRMLIVQTWRAVSGAPQDIPLALCDRRTLACGDISPKTGILAPENAIGMVDPSFKIGGIHYNASQDWYYFPEMKPDELLIFTGFDSLVEEGWRVGHGAFDDRHTYPNAIPRVSFEARFFVFFD